MTARLLATAVILAASSVLARAESLHRSPMAGRWFPADGAALHQLLDQSLQSAARRAGGVAIPRPGLLALVVPHAGLEFSGVAAASAYRLIGTPPPRTAIVLAFSHRVPLEGVATVDVDVFDSPAGPVKVAREVAGELGFPVLDERSVCDHSLENQLPFLRKALPGTPIVPLYVGRLDAAGLAAAAKKLAARVRAGDLLIASSDFTHYGKIYGHTPFPAGARLAERLRARAEQAFDAIGSLEVAAFDRHLESTGDTICGRDPIRLLMAALAEAGRPTYMTTADYQTSADSPASKDPNVSVGYGALAFYPVTSFQVDRPAQRVLLDHARSTLEAMVDQRSRSAAAAPALLPAVPAFAQRTGAFVTIRKGKELRGCVGVLAPNSPLLATIADRTLAAARSDPRFPPLTREEFPVSLEVSLLTPLKRLARWQSWRPGLGAVLTVGGAGALLLPQVAAEMGWSRPEEFLGALARKAGLAPDAYRDAQAKVYVFEAQVFGE